MALSLVDALSLGRLGAGQIGDRADDTPPHCIAFDIAAVQHLVRALRRG